MAASAVRRWAERAEHLQRREHELGSQAAAATELRVAGSCGRDFRLLMAAVSAGWDWGLPHQLRKN